MSCVNSTPSGIVWLLTSLLAIAMLGDHVVGGLVIAILGGVAVGLAAVLEVIGASRESSADKPPDLRVNESRLTHSRPKRWDAFIRWVVANELWILVLLGPFFLFPRRAFVFLFIVVPILWLLRWRVRGRLMPRTPLDVSIALLMVMLLVSVVVSADLDRSFPKLAGIVWGIAIAYALIEYIRSEQDVEWMAVGVAGIGAGVALLTLLGTEWISSGKLLPSQVYAFLPRLLRNVPGTIQGWIHPNEAGGSLAFIVPFLFSVTIMQWNQTQDERRSKGIARLRGWLASQGVIIPLGFTAMVLVLTQSRSALFGVGIALIVFCAIRWRLLRAILIVAGVISLIVLILQGPGLIEPILIGSGGQGGVAGTLDFAGRQEVWQRALYAVQDFPFTGVGLNMFDPVSKVLYPYFLIGPDAVLEHAHNNLLQVTMDLGVPGLVAYLGLVVAFGYMVGEVYIHGASYLERAVALGLGLGMMAHQIFGLTDAVKLGSKPGIIFWVMLGLAGGLWIRSRSESAKARAF